ncbi:MAG: PaaX family transcriptional regulator [Micrococcaceae bacterium]
MPTHLLESLRAELLDGPRPRQMLVTLFADYWLNDGASVPSGALVDLMEHFDVPASGTRTLLSRLSRDGRLASHKEGRRTFYSLAETPHRQLRQGFDSMSAFGRIPDADPPQWTCLTFTIVESQRAQRAKLHRGLGWLGYAPLYDGVWISPRPSSAAVQGLLEDLGVEHATLFEATARRAGRSHGAPTDAWDIEHMQSVYTRFLEQMERAHDYAHSGQITAPESLVMRTQLINVWRAFPRLDPGLPLSMLPDAWPRAEAADAFRSLYNTLEPAATSVVRDTVERHSPSHVGEVQSHQVPQEQPSAPHWKPLHFRY